MPAPLPKPTARAFWSEGNGRGAIRPVALAEPGSGRGMNAHQIDLRAQALRELDDVVRRALIAAHAAIELP